MADDKVVVEGPRTPTRGAQVRITGDAQEAARGGMGADIEANTVAKKAMEAEGAVPDGYTPDGSTVTGEKPAEVVVTGEGEPDGEIPAAQGTTRVEVETPETPAEAPKLTPPLGAPKPAEKK